MWSLSLRKSRPFPQCRSWCTSSYCARYHHDLPKDVTQPVPQAYVPDQVEKDWYTWWQRKGYFSPEKSSGPKFSVVLPPPNVTGTLHLGHALTCAVQDSLVRWNRMNGKACLWIPGSDHAGIATQVVVEKHLSKRGVQRHDLGRDEFLNEVWKWKDEKGNVIFEQLKMMGATLDWSKAAFTMDPKMSAAVTEAFIRLHDSGKIYRKERLVNWCCHLKSAISDIEVEHREISSSTSLNVPGYKNPVRFGQIYTFAYKIYDNGIMDEEIIVSTTRPETLFGDTAVAVNPNDPRYSNLIGKSLWHPLRNASIPVVADSSVDPEFGTGAMKVTPAHDTKDYEVAERNQLEKLNIMEDDGRLNQNCGQYAGIPRLDARQIVLDFLSDKKLLRNVSDHPMSVPLCSRSGDVIEPLLRPQWFVDCKEMASRAVAAVETGDLRIVPDCFQKTWFDWLCNIKDWCISRQLWWGHRIPAYLCTSSSGLSRWVAAHDETTARRLAVEKYGLDAVAEIRQDEDVLDTWFSSSLFPFSTCGWPENTEDLKKYFPLDLMETGHDILFFWVARMVLMSLELTGKLPFREILLHGIICDSQGRKMSKSLGNVIDPLEVIRGTSLKEMQDQLELNLKSGHLSAAECARAAEEKRKMYPEGIPQIGADALRFTLCSYNVKNHFINLDMAAMKTNRLFCNKIWQANRFLFLMIDKLESKPAALPMADLKIIDHWILNRLSRMIDTVDLSIRSYDFHVATEAIYSFVYSFLCDVYLEAVKNLSKEDQEKSTLVLVYCMDVVLRVLAPFMPFLSEELFQRLKFKCRDKGLEFSEAESVVIATYPTPDSYGHWKNADIEKTMDIVLDAVREFRAVKTAYGISKSKPEGFLICPDLPSSSLNELSSLVSTLSGLKSLEIFNGTTNISKNTASCITRTLAGNAVVYLNLSGILDPTVELKKSSDKLKKVTESLAKMRKTTTAPGYAENAPEKVQEGHKEKIAMLLKEIAQLENYVDLVKNLK